MEKQKVKVVSTVKATVAINIPDLFLKREWRQKGATNYIEMDKLEQAMWDPGVEYLFKSGTLYIEDMKHKIAVGLEEEGTEVPKNVIVLTDQQKKRLLTLAPKHELVDMLKKISHEQKLALTHFAIDNSITDLDRCDLLRKETGIDVVKTVIMNRENADVAQK